MPFLLSNRFLIFCCLLFAGTASAQRSGFPLDEWRRAAGIPELGYAVVTPDSIPELQVCGYRRSDRQRSSDTARLTDYFHLGSNTKAITAFLAASLVEEGKLRWDTKLFDLFPQWKAKSNPAYYPATLVDLLSHRARIPPFTSGSELDSLPPNHVTDIAAGRATFARDVLCLPPVPPDGQAYHYSNAGYSIAAQMLEKASGLSWEKLVAQRISKRLGLSCRAGWPNRIDSLQPWGHWMEDGVLTPQGPQVDYDLKCIEPAGDLSMSLPDYARFVQLNLQGLCGRGNALKPRSYEMLHFGRPEYAMGWANGKAGGLPCSDHAGSAGTFYCYAILFPVERVALVVVANSCAEEAERAVDALRQHFLRTYIKR